MLYFKRREIAILKVLFDKAPFGVSKIAQCLGVSNKTVHADIQMINHQFERAHLDFQIVQKRPHGYDLAYCDLNFYDRLRKELDDFQSLQAIHHFDNPRVPMILRAFYLASDYIKAEHFENYFNISDTTLTSDLTEVREVCARYGLEIESVPYRGMRLIGPEMSKRSLYLDLHDLYLYDEKPLFHIHFYDEMRLDFATLYRLSIQLSAFLNHFHLRINDKDFLHVLVFLIDALRLDKKGLKEEKFLENYNYDSEMMDQLQQFFGFKTTRERAYFMHFLSLNLDLGNEHYRFIEEKDLAYSPSFSQTLTKLKQEANISFEESMELMAYFNLFEKRMYHAKRIGYYHYRYHHKKQALTEYLNVSNALSFLIYQDLRQNYGIPFYLDWWMELALTIYNTAYIIPNIYEDVDIVIVNPYGRYFNESFVYRSDLDLGNVHLHYHYEHELKYLNLSEYDAILSVEEKIKNPEDYPIPVIHFDYYVKQKEYSRLWNRIFMTHKKEDFMARQLEKDPYYEKRTSIESVLEQIPPFQKTIYQGDWDVFARIFDLFSDETQPLHWVVFHDDPGESYLKIYQGSGEDYYLVGVSLSGEMLSIKQAESMIRRILREQVLKEQ